jgi:effector-binding domain-containing protein
MTAYEVALKRLDRLTVAAVRDTIGSVDEVGRLLDEVYAYLVAHGIEPAGPALAIWHDDERGLDAEAAVPIAEALAGDGRVSVRELPAAEVVASIVHRGSYSTISQAYHALQVWAAANDYHAVAPERTVYVRGGNDPDDPSYITEILFPVERETRLDVLKPVLEPGDLARFSERARQAIDTATLAAGAQQQLTIGANHLLIGLLDVQNGFAAHALGALGVTREHTDLLASDERAGHAHARGQKLDEPARRVLVDAVAEAWQLKHD